MWSLSSTVILSAPRKTLGQSKSIAQISISLDAVIDSIDQLVVYDKITISQSIDPNSSCWSVETNLTCIRLLAWLNDRLNRCMPMSLEHLKWANRIDWRVVLPLINRVGTSWIDWYWFIKWNELSINQWSNVNRYTNLILNCQSANDKKLIDIHINLNCHTSQFRFRLTFNSINRTKHNQTDRWRTSLSPPVMIASTVHWSLFATHLSKLFISCIINSTPLRHFSAHSSDRLIQPTCTVCVSNHLCYRWNTSDPSLNDTAGYRVTYSVVTVQTRHPMLAITDWGSTDDYK